MSRYKGNGDACPHCKLTYGRFRSGLTYQDVFVMLMDYSDDRTEWRNKRRGTILGKWHQCKKELWERHVTAECPLWAPF
jgi:hypothetical protein